MIREGAIKKLVVIRRASQVFFLALFVYILWSTTHPLTGALAPDLFFKIDPLSVYLISVSERVLIPGFLGAGLMIGLSLVLGRFFCGWVCPLGAFNDWVSSLKKKKIVPAYPASRTIRKVKFFLLGAIGILAVFGIQAVWIFDPLVIMARFVSLNFIPTVTLAADQAMVFVIQKFGLYGGFYDFYRSLKATFLGVRVDYFSNAGIIFIFFLCISTPALFFRRLWCRMLCPLGAIYALAAKPSLLERRVGDCSGCGLCRTECRMGAIEDDKHYAKGECILCMDCVYECPERQTGFGWRSLKTKKQPGNSSGPEDLSRRNFLWLLTSSAVFLGFQKIARAAALDKAPALIRPPGALEEGEFVDRCIRCGNCMKVCVTNGLQPVMLESGCEGIWTPRLVPEIGYCEYNCSLCGRVCPTGAIPELPLEIKQKTPLGVARIDKRICLAWAKDEECIVCEEHCPVPEKAIGVKEKTVNGRRVLYPYVIRDRCIGCGLCQHKCPAEPVRAIRVRGGQTG